MLKLHSRKPLAARRCLLPSHRSKNGRGFPGACKVSFRVVMLVTRVAFAEEASDGLKPIAMNRLGRMVYLAGPNGGGKTRVLSRLAHAIDAKTHTTQQGSAGT